MIHTSFEVYNIFNCHRSNIFEVTMKVKSVVWPKPNPYLFTQSYLSMKLLICFCFVDTVFYHKTFEKPPTRPRMKV